MRKIILAIGLCVPFAAAAADLNCSIKAKKTATKAEMSAMAKVKEEAAKKAAIDKINVKGSTVSKGGLEVEEGCLVYTYDIKVPGKSGAEEVFVDAGTGAVLRVEHESAAKEAAERAGGKAKDKVKEVASDVKASAKETKDSVTGRKPGTDK
jgi:exopolysaccharide biosynthesis protein